MKELVVKNAFTTKGWVFHSHADVAGNKVLCGSYDNNAYLLDKHLRLLHKQGLDNPVWDVYTTPFGNKFWAGTYGMSLYEFDENFSIVQRYPLPGRVKGISYQYDLSRLIAGLHTGSLFEIKSIGNYSEVFRCDDIINEVVSTFDGERTIVCSYDHSVYMLDSNFNKIGQLKTGGYTWGAAISIDATTVAITSFDKHLYLFDRNLTLKAKALIGTLLRGVEILVRPNGQHILVGGDNGFLYLLNESLEIIESFQFPAKLRGIFKIPERNSVLVSCDDHKVYELIDRRLQMPVSINENMVFLIMSIDPKIPILEDVYNTVKEVCSNFSLTCERIDMIEKSFKITDKIIELIENAGLVICDLSGERPNVYYELGYSHGVSKNIIHIAREGTHLHFDIKDFNTIFYSNMTMLKKRLVQRLKALEYRKK